jgi:predicted dienelactone hydrolase
LRHLLCLLVYYLQIVDDVVRSCNVSIVNLEVIVAESIDHQRVEVVNLQDRNQGQEKKMKDTLLKVVLVCDSMWNKCFKTTALVKTNIRIQRSIFVQIS